MPAKTDCRNPVSTYYDTGEIDTVTDLMLAIQDSLTGGYDTITYEVKPRAEHGYLIISVRCPVGDESVIDNYVPGIIGDFWFYNDGKVMQVL